MTENICMNDLSRDKEDAIAKLIDIDTDKTDTCDLKTKDLINGATSAKMDIETEMEICNSTNDLETTFSPNTTHLIAEEPDVSNVHRQLVVATSSKNIETSSTGRPHELTPEDVRQHFIEQAVRVLAIIQILEGVAILGLALTFAIYAAVMELYVTILPAVIFIFSGIVGIKTIKYKNGRLIKTCLGLSITLAVICFILVIVFTILTDGIYVFIPVISFLTAAVSAALSSALYKRYTEN
ncbi:unnamed protein product [Owenia fusiformis]|uniref:Uncharacterized protein n=1 Tax=Owenia fusiformis TaxID=6347 RepID=A0A8J1UJG2_OWEFU|nr:unnamed protein product [Owenia fusiformis]